MEIAVLACQVYEIQITTYLLVRIPHFMFVARPILIPIQAVPYEIPAFVTIDVPRVARHVIVDFTRSVDLTPLTARQGIEKVARSVFRHTHAAAGILDIEEVALFVILLVCRPYADLAVRTIFLPMRAVPEKITSLIRIKPRLSGSRG